MAEVPDLLKYSVLINLEIVFAEPGNKRIVAVQDRRAEDDHVGIQLRVYSSPDPLCGGWGSCAPETNGEGSNHEDNHAPVCPVLFVRDAHSSGVTSPECRQALLLRPLSRIGLSVIRFVFQCNLNGRPGVRWPNEKWRRYSRTASFGPPLRIRVRVGNAALQLHLALRFKRPENRSRRQHEQPKQSDQRQITGCLGRDATIGFGVTAGC